VASACANATSKLACSCIDPFLIIIMEKRMTDYVLLVAAVGICMLWGRGEIASTTTNVIAR
jgi:hypothetical protein